ncbi:hypothetical protein [Pseudidiomarina sediminum]|uniref:hypothetical protein n=1 Tax=Pseudidiomarina sediminum TaxID=431675 RepID=UPI001C964BC7|nr:hypothetical protein [Pseudidiomarina sediminum]MBY6063668.1 hypothetical protein [Pseudidiomarina sediminum]
MKISKCVLAAALLSITGTATAQQHPWDAYDRITFTGDVIEANTNDLPGYNPETYGRFTATVYYEASSVNGELTNSPLRYDGIVKIVSWEVFHKTSGGPLVGGGYVNEDADQSYMIVDTSNGQSILWNHHASSDDSEVVFSAIDTPIVSTVNNIIKLHDGPIEARLSFDVLSRDRGIIGITDNVTVHRVDQDFDGVGLGDACEASIVGGTVSINGIETGVANSMASNGCSIMDQYAACHAEQGEGGMMFGSYRGPSYCEQQVAYTAYREGLIDYTEVRMLRLALMR